MQYNVQRV